MARFVDRHRKRPCLVSTWHPEANLFTPPPRYKGKGRPAVKGKRLPKPREAVSATPRFRRQSVGWYGGGTRGGGARNGGGHGVKSGKGLGAVRWGFVREGGG